MKNLTNKKELLFIHHTSLDPRTKVMTIIDNTTNFILPEDLLDPKILFAIGLTPDDLELCKEFFISG
jgi:hypothetical protein